MGDSRFLATDFDLFPVRTDMADILGVLTTNEERDLSFLLPINGAERSDSWTGTASGTASTASETEGTASVTEETVAGSLTFFLLEGKILALKSCKLWSALWINIMKASYKQAQDSAVVVKSISTFSIFVCLPCIEYLENGLLIFLAYQTIEANHRS